MTPAITPSAVPDRARMPRPLTRHLLGTCPRVAP